MTPEEARARMRRKKARKLPPHLVKAHAVKAADADRRARGYIERWLAGETHQQIADKEGLHVTSVSNCIEAYRKRHPDAKVPKRKSPRKAVDTNHKPTV